MGFWKRKRRGAPNSYPAGVVGNRQRTVLTPVFVETIPRMSEMEKRTLYISMRFATLSHLCPCGCGRLVDVTLGPATRSLIYDGEYITVRPSIGVKFPCESHYAIIRNAIRWYPQISEAEERWYNRVRRMWS